MTLNLRPVPDGGVALPGALDFTAGVIFVEQG